MQQRANHVVKTTISWTTLCHPAEMARINRFGGGVVFDAIQILFHINHTDSFPYKLFSLFSQILHLFHMYFFIFLYKSFTIPYNFFTFPIFSIQTLSCLQPNFPKWFESALLNPDHFPWISTILGGTLCGRIIVLFSTQSNKKSINLGTLPVFNLCHLIVKTFLVFPHPTILLS